MKTLIAIALVPLALACGRAAQKAETAAEEAKEEVTGANPQPAENGPQVAILKPAEPKKPADEEAASLTVINRYSMPACTEGREGQLAYVRDERRFMVCEATNWVDAEVQTKGDKGDPAIPQGVDIALEPAGANCARGGQKVQGFLDANANGELDAGERMTGQARFICDGANGAAGATGATGSAGATGATGAAGSNGNDNHIVTTYSCLGTAWDSSYASEIFELNVHYTVWITAYGDATVRARTWYTDNTDAVPGTNRAGSSTPWATDYHAKSQAEAYNYPVTVHLDLVSGTRYGKMEFSLNKATLQATATYTDADMPTSPTRTWQVSCLKSDY